MVDNLYHVHQFDRRLTLNMEVLACWTAKGFSYRGRAVIVKLKRDRVTVKLRYAVGQNGEHSSGTKIELPRFKNQTCWSSRNCVQPASNTTTGNGKDLNTNA